MNHNIFLETETLIIYLHQLVIYTNKPWIFLETENKKIFRTT